MLFCFGDVFGFGEVFQLTVSIKPSPKCDLAINCFDLLTQLLALATLSYSCMDNDIVTEHACRLISVIQCQ